VSTVTSNSNISSSVTGLTTNATSIVVATTSASNSVVNPTTTATSAAPMAKTTSKVPNTQRFSMNHYLILMRTAALEANLNRPPPPPPEPTTLAPVLSESPPEVKLAETPAIEPLVASEQTVSASSNTEKVATSEDTPPAAVVTVQTSTASSEITTSTTNVTNDTISQTTLSTIPTSIATLTPSTTSTVQITTITPKTTDTSISMIPHDPSLPVNSERPISPGRNETQLNQDISSPVGSAVSSTTESVQKTDDLKQTNVAPYAVKQQQQQQQQQQQPSRYVAGTLLRCNAKELTLALGAQHNAYSDSINAAVATAIAEHEAKTHKRSLPGMAVAGLKGLLHKVAVIVHHDDEVCDKYIAIICS